MKDHLTSSKVYIHVGCSDCSAPYTKLGKHNCTGKKELIPEIGNANGTSYASWRSELHALGVERIRSVKGE